MNAVCCWKKLVLSSFKPAFAVHLVHLTALPALRLQLPDSFTRLLGAVGSVCVTGDDRVWGLGIKTQTFLAWI